MKTLEEILNSAEQGDVKNTVLKLAEHLKAQDEEYKKTLPFAEKLSELEKKIETMENTVAGAFRVVTTLLQEIKNRPDPKFPDPIPFPEKMSMDKPDWYQDADHETGAIIAMKLIAPLIEALGKRIDANHQDMKSVSMDILNKEPEIHEAEPAKPAKKTARIFR